MDIARQIYIISDLHIGGAYPDPKAALPARQRGFRMMTRVPELARFVRLVAELPDSPPVELIINGDFIDFLAEEKGVGQRPIAEHKAPEWLAFRGGKEEALAAFRAVVVRDKILFEALGDLLKSGKRLTILLGNHDIELCLPDVQAALVEVLGPGDLQVVSDGQALDRGEVLVDHGNLFDPANVVDHDRLRAARALYSRGRFDQIAGAFAPPAGSALVAEVMNPIKTMYGFIDLLKPESEPLFALLLAIEPSYRDVLEDAAWALKRAVPTFLPRWGVTYGLRNVAATKGSQVSMGDVCDAETGAAEAASWCVSGPAPDGSAIDELVAGLVNDEEVVSSLRLAGRWEGAAMTNVAGGVKRARWSLFRLLTGEEEGDLDSRISQLQATLRVLVNENSFERGMESKRYLDAATMLSAEGRGRKGYRVVVFGHTHHAKDVEIEATGARYFNTGTWANLMAFPSELTDGASTKEEMRALLTKFAVDVQTNNLDAYLRFEPTYVRVDLGEGGDLIAAELRTYDWKNDRL